MHFVLPCIFQFPIQYLPHTLTKRNQDLVVEAEQLVKASKGSHKPKNASLRHSLPCPYRAAVGCWQSAWIRVVGCRSLKSELG